jgi:meiotically up-regulated gene 157 (Mug157) protein
VLDHQIRRLSFLLLAGIPSLLSLPYLGYVDMNDKIYLNTRSFIQSNKNPYWFNGTIGEGQMKKYFQNIQLNTTIDYKY